MLVIKKKGKAVLFVFKKSTQSASKVLQLLFLKQRIGKKLLLF